jgi:thiol-disulfide isomerase/thioredoxin
MMKKFLLFFAPIVLMFVFISCANGSDNVAAGSQVAVAGDSEIVEQNEKPQIEESKTVPEGEEIELGNEIGNDLGDFDSYSPDSTILKLSDYRGKLTMLVLWNSLCGHCVTENQKHADTYNEYRDKQFVNGDGFEIYAIALDKERATWIEHLDKMNYPWDGNVYVIDSWKDPEIRYFGVKNLPGTFLIDENGIVVAKMFSATELKGLLDGYLKK